jgi:hypothetical protein
VVRTRVAGVMMAVMMAATTVVPAPLVVAATGRRRAATAVVAVPVAVRPAPDLAELTPVVRAALVAAPRMVPAGPAHGAMPTRRQLGVAGPPHPGAAPGVSVVRGVPHVGTVRLRSATPMAARALGVAEGPRVRRVLPELGVVRLGGPRVVPMIAPFAVSRRRPNGERWRSRPPVGRVLHLR